MMPTSSNVENVVCDCGTRTHYHHSACALRRAKSDAVENVICADAGPGRGYCDRCAAGDYLHCRYMPPAKSGAEQNGNPAMFTVAPEHRPANKIGFYFRVITPGRQLLDLDGWLFDIKEARALRDWLNEVLPP